MLRRLRAYTGQGHEKGLTCVRAATCLESGNLKEVESADDVVLTCSKDGTVGLWILDPRMEAFTILCMLLHLDADKEPAVVKDAAAYMNRPDPADLPVQSHPYLFVVSGTSDGSTRLWVFNADITEDGVVSYQNFADSETEYGIPQRVSLLADDKVVHECSECKHDHAVLSLAVLPRQAKQSSSVIFNIIAGTTAGSAGIYKVYQDSTAFRIDADDRDGRRIGRPLAISDMSEEKSMMKHTKSTVIHQVVVAQDFLAAQSSSVRESALVATCGGMGRAKLWRVSDITDTKAKIDLLATFLHKEPKSKEFLPLKSVAISPAWEENASRYLVTSSFDHFQQQRSRIFAWSLQGLGSPSEEVREFEEGRDRKYVFRAANIAFWYPRGDTRKEIGRYVYCVTSAPDLSAKMFRLVNMETGFLTKPLLNEKEKKALDFRESLSKQTNVANEDAPAQSAGLLGYQTDSVAPYDDKTEILHIFRHSKEVNWVLTIRMNSDFWRRKESGISAKPSPKKRRASMHSDDDFEEDWLIMTAGDDKVAMSWDPMTSQPVHSLRAATLQEMYLPIILELVTMVQLSAFSFTKPYKWNHTVKPIHMLSSAFIIDTPSIAKLIGSKVNFIFAGGLVLSVMSALLFIALVLSGIRDNEQKRSKNIEMKLEYRKEVANGRTGLGKKPAGPEHRRHNWSQRRLIFYNEAIFYLSSVLLVPISKTMIRFFDCNRDPQHNPPYFVELLPDVACYESLHLSCAPVIAFILALFLFLLLPFATAKNDPTVVSRADLCNFRQWKRNTMQTCDAVYLGPMHVDYMNFFWYKLYVVFAKVAAPCASIMLTSRVLMRASCLCFIHFLGCVQVVCFPCYLASSTHTLHVYAKIIILWAAVSSVWSSYLLDDTAQGPAIMWYGGLACFTLVTMVVYLRYDNLENREENDRHFAAQNVRRVQSIEREAEEDDDLQGGNAAAERSCCLL